MNFFRLPAAATAFFVVAGGIAASFSPQHAYAYTTSTTHNFWVPVKNSSSLFVYGNINGYAATKFGPFNSYNQNGAWFGPIGIFGSLGPTTVNSSGINSFSSATSSLAFNSAPITLTNGLVFGYLNSNASAFAGPLPPPGGQNIANAYSAAKINIWEGRANKFGQIRWRPRFSDFVSASARSVYDPVKINFFLQIQALLSFPPATVNS